MMLCGELDVGWAKYLGDFERRGGTLGRSGEAARSILWRGGRGSTMIRYKNQSVCELGGL